MIGPGQGTNCPLKKKNQPAAQRVIHRGDAMEIASIVVTFNRKNDLIRNLKKQLEQTAKIDTIWIIDNASSDGTEELLVESGMLAVPNVQYIRLEENLGGAGGFEYGLRKAFDSGADLFLLMDDDGYFRDPNTLERLLKRIPSNNLFFLCPMVMSSDTQMSFPRKDFMTKEDCQSKSVEGIIKDYVCPFNGTLISRQLVAKIGFVEGRLFIRGDEVDYTLRAQNAGAYMATVTDSFYYHPYSGTKEIKTVLGETFINNYDSPWKEYYMMRNAVYHRREKKLFFLRAFRLYCQKIAGLYLFHIPERRIHKAFLKKGFADGLKGRLGKTVQPGQKQI